MPASHVTAHHRHPSPAQRRVTAFVSRHNLAWDTTSGIAACGFLVASFANDQDQSTALTATVAAFTLAFVAEFAVRCWAAPSRRRYARDHWLDLVSCVPIPLMGGLRGLRLLRLVRLLATRRAIQAIGARTTDRGRFGFLAPVLVLLWLVTSAAVWTLEHDVNPAITTFVDALQWTFLTSTTVGYGEIRAVTPAGQVLAGVLAFIGLGLVGFASARLTTIFLHQAKDDPGAAVTAVEIARLRTEIGELKALLTERTLPSAYLVGEAPQSTATRSERSAADTRLAAGC
jgi:voltage-gated potassium channel